MKLNKNVTEIPTRERIDNTGNTGEKPKLRAVIYCRFSTADKVQAGCAYSLREREV